MCPIITKTLQKLGQQTKSHGKWLMFKRDKMMQRYNNVLDTIHGDSREHFIFDPLKSVDKYKVQS